MFHTFSTSRLTTDSLCFPNGWLICTPMADFHHQVKCHTRHTAKFPLAFILAGINYFLFCRVTPAIDIELIILTIYHKWGISLLHFNVLKKLCLQNQINIIIIAKTNTSLILLYSIKELGFVIIVFLF